MDRKRELEGGSWLDDKVVGSFTGGHKESEKTPNRMAVEAASDGLIIHVFLSDG